MAAPESDDKKSLIRLLDEARNELEACKANLQDLLNKRRTSWEELVGRDAVLAMQQDRKLAERYLEHPEANYRFVAVEIIRDHWKQDVQFAATCERLVNADDDVGVRGAAATSLGVYYDSTGNQRIGQLLARIVKDTLQPEALRNSAYQALWQLARGRDSLYASILLSPATIRFPDDVDWSLVSHFLSD